MTHAQQRLAAIGIGVLIVSAIEVAFVGHTVGEMLDRAYFIMGGAAIALFVK